MSKLIATLNVIAWSGFWAFGYIALTADANGNQVVVAVILAALGAAGGLWAWLHVVQICESNGLSKRPRFAVPEHRRVLNEGEDA